jgi:hypothetical protein
MIRMAGRAAASKLGNQKTKVGQRTPTVLDWLRERSLTLTLMAIFALAWLGQVWAGHLDFNRELSEHGRSALSLLEYLGAAHVWEATFENWESEFLQMCAFVVLTAFLVQKGSPESRRLGAIEESDADPRRFRDHPDVPSPVRRGGWRLRVYEYSLGLALGALFLVSMVGHSIGGWRTVRAEEMLKGQSPPSWGDFVTSARFWFESLQNWQSEFLAIGAMVWLSVYLRYRGSPESKPVHAAHHETGR